MEKYREIDLKTWHRKELFQLYTEEWKGVAFSVTKKLDVTELITYLKENKIKKSTLKTSSINPYF